jgi:hypothetical protein
MWRQLGVSFIGGAVGSVAGSLVGLLIGLVVGLLAGVGGALGSTAPCSIQSCKIVISAAVGL